MPKKDVGEPRGIRAFSYHGVEFTKTESKTWTAICPFCDEAKLYIDSDTSEFTCFKCPSSSWSEQYKDDKITKNNYGFIRYLWRVSYENTKLIDYSWLEAYRGLSAQSLRNWGICKSIITGEWIVPGYGVEEPPNIVQLYKYVKQYDKKLDGTPIYKLFPTPGFNEGESHGILLPQSRESNNTNRVYVCEGVWDGISLSNILELVRKGGNETNNAGIDGSIIAVPGCGIFNKGWTRYTAGKDVVFLFDNDHPKLNLKTNTYSQASLSGCRRITGIISSGDISIRAKSISWLDWNLDGKGYDPNLPSGYDLRDYLIKDGKSLEKLLKYVVPIPNSWIGGSNTYSNSNGSKLHNDKIQPIECRSWKELINAFRLAAKWTVELNGGLAVGLACAASVRGVGEPLWIRLISPPSTYKSQLCKAIGTNDKYTLLNDGMNGFFSGLDMNDGKDHSLVVRWFDKCLITKEGATLMKASNSEEIISQARAIYDGDFSKNYKNSIGTRNYTGWRGTWLLAGTPEIKNYDDNELGPRFIDYCIVKDMTEELERDIIMRALTQQVKGGIVNGSVESADDPEYLNARKLTAGYLNYLRIGIDTGSLKLPDIPYSNLEKILTLSMFIERMRARPSRDSNTESTSIALATRVSKQLVKLTQFLCIVMQKESIDSEVMGIVSKIALDTSSGYAYNIVEALRNASHDGDEGLEPKSIANRCGRDLREIGNIILFLSKINVLDIYFPTNHMNPVSQSRFKLTDKFIRLYDQVRRISNG